MRARLGTEIQNGLGLRTAPVGVTFQERPPDGLSRVGTPAPAGCSYWSQAAGGRAFYTEAADQLNCPVGAYTHGVELSPEKGEELSGLIGVMAGLGYLNPAEVPSIPRRGEPFRVAVYSSLDEGAGPPDVVLVSGNARQIMMLAEAAQAAGLGAGSGDGLMGRPTCAAIPQVLRTGRCALSLGCIGNRVYTGLGDDEMYFAMPGAQVEKITDSLAVILRANRELEEFHRARAG